MDATETAAAHAEELTWGDDRLLAWASGRLAVPRAAPADSFVLHAPLELLARADLLRRLPEVGRGPARLRILQLVDRYAAWGDPVAPVGDAGPDDGDLTTLVGRLVEAVGSGDLPAVDRLAAHLGSRAGPDELRRLLGPPVAPLLSAAAHAPIGLHLLGRASAVDGTVLRGCLRELARRPAPVVPVDGLALGTEPLEAALLAVPCPDPPVSGSIRPMVERGVSSAPTLLADVSDDPVAAYRDVCRVAALAMVQEADDDVPYGWTHALTIPQAVLSLGIDARTAVAVAGTQALGFRASMGTRRLDPIGPVPDVPADAGTDLVAWASRHHDAHVVKYVVALLDATRVDPGAAGLYRAAGARLAAWWRAEGDDGFFGSGPYSPPWPEGGAR